MLEYISIFIVSCIVLGKSGGWVVRSLSNIARVLAWREFTVALLVMAIASSLPELFIGITSSIAKKPQLSVGNILGSNILALTLLIGIGAILAQKLKFEGKIIRRSKFFAAFFILLPFVLVLDGSLSRIDGIILIVAFLAYLRELIGQQRMFSKAFNRLRLKDWAKLRLLLREIGVFFGALFLLLISAQGIVFSATHIATAYGLSLVVIGILGVAIGTSLPEIVFAVKSIQLGHREMVLGNAIGSVVVNVGLVLGVTALISPFEIKSISPYANAIVFSLIAIGLFLLFSKTKQEISRREAICLILVYLVFFIIELVLGVIY